MNIFDLLIIYLACGAPFGAYYFLYSSETLDPVTKSFRTLLNFVFWPHAAFVIVRGRLVNKNTNEKRFDDLYQLDAAKDRRVEEIQIEFEKIFFPDSAGTGIYAFREVFDRYTGLTIAAYQPQDGSSSPESEVFKLSGRRDIELADICSNRRNRSRLIRHQTHAREDLSKTLLSLSITSTSGKKAEMLAIELAGILDDTDAMVDFQEIFASKQTKASNRVNDSGSEVWKPEIHKQSSASRLSVNMRTAPALTNRSRED